MRQNFTSSWRNRHTAIFLRNSVRVVHYLLVVVVLLGWLPEDVSWLLSYIVLLPLIAIQWRLNDNSCILTNLEYWLAHESQDRPKSRRQEPFIGRILEKIYRRKVTFRTTQFWSHGLLTLAWFLGFVHLQSLVGR